MIRTLALALILIAAPLVGVSPAFAQTAAQAAGSAPAGDVAIQHVTLNAPDGREIDVNIWPAAHERGVVVFSHGFNGSPGAYHRILSAWAEHGFTVVAPLHVDSLQHPHHADFDNRSAFTTRLTDLAVVRGFVRAAHPVMPMIAAGHSFGSLMSLIEGGAMTVAGNLGDRDVRGVIAFSTAGAIPGVVLPTTYAGLSNPLLLITGDQDVVPGYAADWHDHRQAFDLSPPGEKTLLIFAGADHELVGKADDADFALLVQATDAFLDAYAAGDAAAQAILATLPAPQGVSIERR